MWYAGYVGESQFYKINVSDLRYRRKAEKGVPAKNGNHKYFITVTVTPHGAAGRQFLLSSECHNCHININTLSAAQDHGWILGWGEDIRFLSSREKEKIYFRNYDCFQAKIKYFEVKKIMSKISWRKNK